MKLIAKLIVLLILIDGFLIISNYSFAGWFSPKPPELMLNKQVKVQQGQEVKIPIIFNERASYRISFNMKERVGFYSEEGRNIKWGERFNFKMILEDSSKVYIEQVIDTRLDHSQGYGLNTIQVPGDAPKGKSLFIKLVFLDVGSEYNAIYESSSLVVEKLPYIRILD